jgi:hypothetical protein
VLLRILDPIFLSKGNPKNNFQSKTFLTESLFFIKKIKKV